MEYDIAVMLYSEANSYEGEIGDAICEVAKHVCAQDSLWAERFILGMHTVEWSKDTTPHGKLIHDVLYAIYELVG